MGSLRIQSPKKPFRLIYLNPANCTMRNNNIKQNRRQYKSIDLFKFLFSIMVVAIHARPFENIHNEKFQDIYSLIADCTVPFFFLASGFFFVQLFRNKSPKNQEIYHKNT